MNKKVKNQDIQAMKSSIYSHIQDRLPDKENLTPLQRMLYDQIARAYFYKGVIWTLIWQLIISFFIFAIWRIINK